ncbi:MAG: alpha-amylase family glycosyl hydrolase [Acutalibacteraceae bacterium]|nr:alpha-amylase family glycosyl hydrolase [Acutalibacteraceae bacterium]
MNGFKRVISIVVAVMLVVTCGIFTVNAATTDEQTSEAGSGIKIHYYGSSTVPNIYYWNSLPTNINSPTYPGPKMTADSSAAGPNCYTYSFSNVTKINFMFVENGVQSKELTREYTEKSQGEWWYKDGKWYTSDPYCLDDYERTDLREDTIYFVITTRFYDGDTGNNVHCWDDTKANNPDSDPAWRGDFKGLIEKLDYIKALGFSAIWITPVVSNASGYDYHGYHSFDMATVDPRYESSDVTYEDLIAAAHEKGMKIVQDVVWNHTGNFGDPFLAPMFTKEYSSIQDLGTADCMQVIPGSDLAKNYPDYENLTPDAQFQARLDCMKAHVTSSLNSNEYYHREKNMGYESSIEQQGSMAGDCVDINTENPVVAKYITDTYVSYAELGVDAFRLDTEKHINRWTLNSAYFPMFSELKAENFHIFGEVCSRVRETWNHNIPSSSPAFFTWAETESAWQGNWDTSSPTANIQKSIDHYDSHRDPSGCPTSNNAFLDGISYHNPDYSKANGTSVIDFTMHWNFENAGNAYRAGLTEDQYMNDSTWNVMYVDSHDYGPDGMEKTRYSEGTQAWAENLNLIFTFRGIPCLYYGSEIEFAKGNPIDVGPNAPLSTTGRAYYGDNIEGTVTATDFSEYTASGTVADTLNYPLAKHIQKLNAIRRAVPALQKGQYTNSSNYVDGNMAYIRRYTGEGVDSLALVTITDSATFKNIPNGTYIDAVTGDTKTVTNGTLSVSSVGKGNCRVYVLSSNGYTGISGKIGETTTYLK